MPRMATNRFGKSNRTAAAREGSLQDKATRVPWAYNLFSSALQVSKFWCWQGTPEPPIGNAPQKPEPSASSCRHARDLKSKPDLVR